MKTNKEVIDALTAYFMRQDPQVVANALAALMVDLNRFANFESLPKDEQENVSWRFQKNLEQLHHFIQNGGGKDLKLWKINSRQEK